MFRRGAAELRPIRHVVAVKWTGRKACREGGGRPRRNEVLVHALFGPSDVCQARVRPVPSKVEDLGYCTVVSTGQHLWVRWITAHVLIT